MASLILRAPVMRHDKDPKKELMDSIGDLSKLRLFGHDVLVAVYAAPQQYASGLYRTDRNRDEDLVQSAVGLVVKLGRYAFEDDDHHKFHKDDKVKVGDWVWVTPADGRSRLVKGVYCRTYLDRAIKGEIPDPDYVY